MRKLYETASGKFKLNVRKRFFSGGWSLEHSPQGSSHGLSEFKESLDDTLMS